MPDPTTVLDARLLGEGDWITVTEVCRLCLIDRSAIVELVELGVVVSRGPSPDEWLVPAAALPRLRVAGGPGQARAADQETGAVGSRVSHCPKFSPPFFR